MIIKNSKIIIAVALLCLSAWPATAQDSLAQKLSGRILLQVESRGQAWYVNPADQKRYFLGRPIDAFNLMRALGIGITNDNLAKIPEKSQVQTDVSFAKLNAGKIFLQVQNSGQAWYVNPVDFKRYYLGRPMDAFAIMRTLALGITNKNLSQITVGQLPPAIVIEPVIEPPIIITPPNPPVEQSSTLDQAAASIRSNNTAETKAFFIESMAKAIEYTMNSLNSESKLLLANILSGATLISSTATEKIYSTKAYFSLGGYDVQLNFHVKKQPSGTWLIANL